MEIMLTKNEEIVKEYSNRQNNEEAKSNKTEIEIAITTKRLIAKTTTFTYNTQKINFEQIPLNEIHNISYNQTINEREIETETSNGGMIFAVMIGLIIICTGIAISILLNPLGIIGIGLGLIILVTGFYLGYKEPQIQKDIKTSCKLNIIGKNILNNDNVVLMSLNLDEKLLHIKDEIFSIITDTKNHTEITKNK